MVDKISEEFTITGVESADYDCDTFDIPEEEFIRLRGKAPTVFDRSYFYQDLYRYYGFSIPDHIMSNFEKGDILKIGVRYDIEVIGKAKKIGESL